MDNLLNSNRKFPMINYFFKILVSFSLLFVQTLYAYEPSLNPSAHDEQGQTSAIESFIHKNQERNRRKNFQFKKQLRDNPNQYFQFGPGSGSGSGTNDQFYQRPGTLKMKEFELEQSTQMSLCEIAYLAQLIMNDEQISEKVDLQNILLMELDLLFVQNHAETIKSDASIYDIKCFQFDLESSRTQYQNFFKFIFHKYDLNKDEMRSIFDLRVIKSLNLT